MPLIRWKSVFLINLGFSSAQTLQDDDIAVTSSTENGKFLQHAKHSSYSRVT